MKDYASIYKSMIYGKYYNAQELLYDTNANIFLSPFEYKQFLEYIDTLLEKENGFAVKIDLKSFNGFPLHFSNSDELKTLEETYYKTIIEDDEQNHLFLSARNIDEITKSRIYSELEGSLNIESVPTTRKAMEELGSGKRDPMSLNDQIMKNMIEGVEFVNKVPNFNANNLFKLYTILSKGCLDEEDELLEGHHYRHDGVEVGGYKGCPVEMINECMESLFTFVNDNLTNPDLIFYLPHIAHYYIAYIHPYFDYNGRTARMVSYWVALLTNSDILPPIVSEAINQTKGKYYAALANTRDAHNDLTYFLIYIYDISIKYFLTYQNIEFISNNLKQKDIILSNLEKNYFKKILISSKGKFTHEDFTKWINVQMSKQGALKILNTFEEYGILKSTISESKKKLFEINSASIKFKVD